MYRHSDGYPDNDSGVKAVMAEFFPKFLAERGAGDTEYMGAQLLAHMIKDHQKWAATLSGESTNSFHFIGYGICGDRKFHSDIEFYYAITPIVTEEKVENMFLRGTSVKVEVFDVEGNYEKPKEEAKHNLVDTWTFEAKKEEKDD